MKTRHVLARSLLLGLLAVGCASEAPRTAQVICQEAPAYSSRWGSETASSVFLGNTFQVTAAALTGRLRITGAQGDSGTARFLEPRCVAPYPLQGQARWIHVPTPAPVKAEGLVSRAPGPGWEMGDEVEVLTVNESWVPSGQSAVLSQGNVLGFIPTTALGDKPPPLERYTEVLRAQLARHTFDAALALTRRALKFFPQEALLHRLQGHLVTLSGGTAPKPPKSLPKLAALPDVLPEQPLVLSEEEAASDQPLPVFTTAVGLRLRESAESSGKVLATLPVNQPLALNSIEKDWAEVRFDPGHQIIFDYSGTFHGFMDEPSLTGYVSLRFLARAPLSPEQWLARGQAALKAGRAAEAIVLLHRALESTADKPLEACHTAYMDLIEASFAGERFESLFQTITARRTAKPVKLSRDKPSRPLVVLGCHGDMTRAKILDLRDKSTHAWAGLSVAAAWMKEPHLCIARVDTREPVEPSNYCQEGVCERPWKLQQADELYEKTLKPEYDEWIGEVGAHYDSSPYFYFEPRTLQGFAPGKRLVFYDIPLKEYSFEELSGVELKKSDAHVVTLDLPTTTDWEQLEVWIELPSHLDSEFGLAVVDNEEEVSEWIQQREEYFEFGPFRVAEGKLPRDARSVRVPFPLTQYTGLISATDRYWWGTLP